MGSLVPGAGGLLRILRVVQSHLGGGAPQARPTRVVPGGGRVVGTRAGGVGVGGGGNQMGDFQMLVDPPRRVYLGLASILMINRTTHPNQRQ